MLVRIFNLICSCLVLALGMANAEPTERLTFRQAMQRALEKNPEYLTAVENERISVLNRQNATSRLLPSVEAKAQHAYTVGEQAISPVREPWSNSVGLVVNEILYDNGRSWREREIQRAQERIARLNLLQTRHVILQRASKAFFDYSTAAANLELQTAQYELIRKQFNSIQSRYHGGISSNRDFLRIKAQLKKAELRLTSQRFDVEGTRASLNRAIGEKALVDFVALKPEDAFFDGMTAPSPSVAETFELRLIDLQSLVTELRLEAVQREIWPRLSLGASYAYTQPQYVGRRNDPVDDPVWEFQTLLNLEYTIWDWGIRRRNVEIASSQRQIDHNTFELSRLFVSQEIKKLVAQFLLLRESHIQSKQIVKDDAMVFQSLNSGYRDGKVTYLELITALSDSFSSRSEHLSLQFQMLKLRADLAYYQGNVDATFADL